jgi:alanine racemase
MPMYIDSKIIKANFNKITRLYKKIPGIVLKSNAYGLGINNILPILLQTACEKIFVSSVTEALQIRKITNKFEIIIFDPINDHKKEVFLEQNITPILNDWKELDIFYDIFRQVPFVLNVNVGMNRLGVDWQVILDNYEKLKLLPIKMIMTHFHITHNNIIDPVNLIQKDNFTKIKNLFPNISTSLASSNTLNFGDDFIGDIPRIGKALYGLFHKNKFYKNCLKFEFPITLVRYVLKGEIVGYNGYKITNNTYLGIINIGYAQGLSLEYINNLKIIWKQKKYMIISISMEYTIIKFNDDMPKVGDKILFLDDFITYQSSTYYLERLLRFQNINKEVI